MSFHFTTQNPRAHAKGNTIRTLLFVIVGGLTALVSPNTAFARLGSFNSNDGYQLVLAGPPNYNWADVTYYNAGAYGVNAGGGPGPTMISPDSGKWKLISQVGGFFGSSAARSSTVGSAPPYPTVNPGNTIPAYLVGGHFPGHNQNTDGQNLAFRNDTPPGTGPAVYDYYLDQYDLGSTPSLITSGNIKTDFYFLPSVGGQFSGGLPPDKFTLSFVDTSGNIGLQWGYAMDNQVTWRTNPSGPWNYTGIIAAQQNPNGNPQWDGVSIDINLTNDTFQFDYYTAATNTWSTVVPAGTPLNAPGMQDFTRLRWRMEDNVSGYFFGKNYFDDFSFKAPTVPEPSTIALVGLAVAFVGNRRRQRQS
ncbi:MAG: PEP-CTERM sorting domain-containing protein [Pirellulales bacterium]